MATLKHRMDKIDTSLLIYKKEDYNRQLHQALLSLPISLSLSLYVMVIKAVSSQ